MSELDSIISSAVAELSIPSEISFIEPLLSRDTTEITEELKSSILSYISSNEDLSVISEKLSIDFASLKQNAIDAHADTNEAKQNFVAHLTRLALSKLKTDSRKFVESHKDTSIVLNLPTKTLEDLKALLLSNKCEIASNYLNLILLSRTEEPVETSVDELLYHAISAKLNKFNEDKITKSKIAEFEKLCDEDKLTYIKKLNYDDKDTVNLIANHLRDTHQTAAYSFILEKIKNKKKEDSIKHFDFPCKEVRVSKSGEVFEIIKKVRENIEYVLDFNKIKIRNNIISNTVEILVDGVKINQCDKLGTLEEVKFFVCDAFADNLVDINASTVKGHLASIAKDTPYNPAKEYILSSKWDGVSRFEQLVKCFSFVDKSVEATEAHIQYLRKWLIGGVYLFFNDEGKVKMPNCLTLCGPQGLGKTSFFAKLLPQELVLLGHNLDPLNKDSIIKATSHAICELGELDGTFSKSDAHNLKAYLSNPNDKMRLPYGESIVERPRRTLHGASVNKERFLVDETGNRRFFVMYLDGILLDELNKIDFQQVWAEAYHYFKAGESFDLDKKYQDYQAKSNEEFETVSAISQLCLDNFAFNCFAASTTELQLTASHILQLIGITTPTNNQFKDLASFLSKKGIKKKRLYGKNANDGYGMPAYIGKQFIDHEKELTKPKKSANLSLV